MEFFSHFYNIRRKIVIVLVFILVFQNFFKEKKSLSNFYTLPMSVLGYRLLNFYTILLIK